MKHVENMMKRWTTSRFRAEVLQKYPALETSIEFRIFFQYLCFSTNYEEYNPYIHKNKDETFLIIPATEIWRELYGETIYDRKWNCEVFLLSFRERVLPELEWSNYDRENRIARTIINNGFDQEINEIIEKEIMIDFDISQLSGVFVDFVSGKSYDNRIKCKNNKLERDKHEEELKKFTLNETQKKILNYLDAINGGHLFLRKLNDNRKEVNSLIENLPINKKKIMRRILTSIEIQPQPFYRPSYAGKTARLSNCNDSVISLKREIRKTLCRGWVECDLQSSQFAIIAQLLDAPTSKAFINSGENLWQAIYFFVCGKNEKPPQEIKDAIKEVLYGIAFGRSEKMTQWALNFNETSLGKKNPIIPCEFILKKYGIEKVLEHPIIRELFTLREKWYREIEAGGGAVDCYGVFHKIEKGRRASSIGATIIQNIELEIIAPIFDVAIKNKSHMQITIFQHDGACISFHENKKAEMTMKQMNEAVKKRARDFGVQIKLEFTELK